MNKPKSSILHMVILSLLLLGGGIISFIYFKDNPETEEAAFLISLIFFLPGGFFAFTVFIYFFLCALFNPQGIKTSIITGVVTNITEVENGDDIISPEALKIMSMISIGSGSQKRPLISDAPKRFIVTCTYTLPDTGETLTAVGTNEDPLKLSIGDNVTVIYNEKNPKSCFVDVDGLYSS